MSLNDEPLLKQIKSSLDNSVKGLDGETRSKLTNARHNALAETEKSKNWLPISGIAFASVMALSALLFNNHYIQNKPVETLPIEMLASSEDIEMMVSVPDPELLEELDFYYWLEQGEHNHAG